MKDIESPYEKLLKKQGDIDLKTIFIGMFLLAFIFFGINRMDVGRYQLVSAEYDKSGLMASYEEGLRANSLRMLDTKTGNVYYKFKERNINKWELMIALSALP